MYRNLHGALIAFALTIGCGGIDALDQDGDGYTIGDGDCWDAPSGPPGSNLTGADIHPGATDTWYDGIDQDCADDSDYDADADGHDSEQDGDGTDCDDDDASVHPGATETWYDGVDADCDENNDYDADGDGYDSELDGDGSDCDDNDATVNPGATETWYDGVDANCNGDDDYDADGDGYAYDGSGGLDCDDEDEEINPGADEICGDHVDQDCVPDNCGLEANIFAADAVTRIDGELANDYFGYSIASIGDWNGDGMSEVLVGASGHDVSGQDGGAVYVFATPLEDHEDTTTATYGASTIQSPMAAGTAVASAANVRGNGDLDFTVGMPYYDNYSGVVLLYPEGLSGGNALDGSGTYFAVLFGNEEYDYFGLEVTSLGDTDGDGYGEILVAAKYAQETPDTDGDGSPEAGGAAYLFDGSLDNAFVNASDADVTFYGTSNWDYVGSAVRGLGDVSGDGLNDWAIGAVLADDGGSSFGAVYVFLGPQPTGSSIAAASADVIMVGEEASSDFGRVIAGPGDVDDDGYTDITLGAAYYDGDLYGAGRVYVHTSPLSASLSNVLPTDAAIRITGEQYDYLGYEVGTVDLDGDDLDDIAYMAPSWGGKAPGVYVHAGSNGTGSFSKDDATSLIHAEGSTDGIGDQLVNAGDQTGDGVNDLLIGAPWAQGDGDYAGSMYLIAGAMAGD